MIVDFYHDDDAREQVCVWLRSVGIDPNDIPIDATPVLDGDQLSVAVMLRNENGRHYADPHHANQVAKSRRTFTVPLPVPAEVAEWVRPPCPTCGR